jgi:ABC-2 type transport system permease protein
MQSQFFNTLSIFYQFFRRDLYVYSKQLNRFVINYVFIYPSIYAICFAFLQARNYFGDQAQQLGTLSFSGVVLLIMASTAYRSTFDTFFDIIDQKHISFCITLISPRLLLLQRILFASLLTFCLNVPFYFVARLLIGHMFDMSNMQWTSLLLILAVGSVCCVSYHMLAAVSLKCIEQIGSFWFRVNFVLLVFGGTWIPHYVIRSIFPVLGYLTYLNPITYITEGLRQSIIGGQRFLSILICVAALICFIVVFITLSFKTLKKRIDHI